MGKKLEHKVISNSKTRSSKHQNYNFYLSMISMVAIVAIIAMSIAIPNNGPQRWAASIVPINNPDPYYERSSIPDPNTDSVGSSSKNTVGQAGASLRDYYVYTTEGVILKSQVPEVIGEGYGEGCMGTCSPNSHICEPCGCNACPAQGGIGPCVCGSDEEEWGGSPLIMKPTDWVYSEDMGYVVPEPPEDPGE